MTSKHTPGPWRIEEIINGVKETSTPMPHVYRQGWQDACEKVCDEINRRLGRVDGLVREVAVDGSTAVLPPPSAPSLHRESDMTSKHTPGPWRSRKIRYGGYAIEAELFCMNGLRAWFTVANIYVHDDAESLMSNGAVADAKDDARLIAAAPDLLEACRYIVEIDENGDEEIAVAKARAAISKAQGE